LGVRKLAKKKQENDCVKWEWKGITKMWNEAKKDGEKVGLKEKNMRSKDC
jgi:hypothetical protein